jgi:hypothetical protein
MKKENVTSYQVYKEIIRLGQEEVIHISIAKL